MLADDAARRVLAQLKSAGVRGRVRVEFELRGPTARSSATPAPAPSARSPGASPWGPPPTAGIAVGEAAAGSAEPGWGGRRKPRMRPGSTKRRPRQRRELQVAAGVRSAAAWRSATSRSTPSRSPARRSAIGSGSPFTIASKKSRRSPKVGRVAFAHPRASFRIAASRRGRGRTDRRSRASCAWRAPGWRRRSRSRSRSGRCGRWRAG